MDHSPYTTPIKVESMIPKGRHPARAVVSREGVWLFPEKEAGCCAAGPVLQEWAKLVVGRDGKARLSRVLNARFRQSSLYGATLLEYTSFPLTKVFNTEMPSSSRGAILVGSLEITIRSASFPCSIEPFCFSSNSA
jgi:hypothetical protein